MAENNVNVKILSNLRETINNTKEFNKNIKNTKLEINSLNTTVLKTLGTLKSVTSIALTMTKATDKLATSTRLLDTIFANTFKQAKEFIANMSEMTGLDEATFTKQLALFGQLGQTLQMSEKDSEKLAENLTTLTTKLGLLYNIDSKTMGSAIQRAVQGNQRTLMSMTGLYSNDVNQAALLASKGIEKEITSLNDAEAAIVRYASISKLVTQNMRTYGEAVNSVAWQKMVLTAQVQRVSVALGKMFYPILEKILPVLNGIMMVIEEIISGIAILFGYTETNKLATNAEGASIAYGGLGDNIKKASNEAKKSLRSFDQLNNIATLSGNEKDSNGGIGIDSRILGLLNETDNTFLNIRNKATEIRDRIKEWLTNIGLFNINGKINVDFLKKIWGWIKGIAILLAGIQIIKMIGQFSNFITMVGGGIPIASNFAAGISGIWKVLKGGKTVLKQAKNDFKLVYTVTESVGEAAKFTTQRLWNMIPAGVKVAGGLAGLAVSGYNAYDSMRDLSEGTKPAEKAIMQLGISLGGAAASGALIGSVIPGVGTAIGALTGVLSAGVAAVIGYQTETDKLANIIKKSSEETQKNAEAWNQLKESSKLAADGANAEIKYYQELLSELKLLVDANGKVKSGYEDRVKFILGQLNSAFGTEYSLTNGQITKNGELVKSIEEITNALDERIQKAKGQAYLDAYSEQWKNALTNEQKYYNQLKNDEENESKAREELQKMLDQYGLTWDDYKKKTTKYALALQRMNIIESGKFSKRIDNWDKANKAIKQASEIYTDSVNTTIFYSNLLEATETGNIDEINKAIYNYDQFVNNSGMNYARQVDEIIQKNQLYKKTLNGTEKEITEQAQIQKDAQLLALAKNLALQVRTVEDMTPDMANAWAKISTQSKNAFNQGLEYLPQDARNLMTKVKDELTGKNLKSDIGVKFTAKGDYTQLNKDLQSINSKISILQHENPVGGSMFDSLQRHISALGAKVRTFAGGGFPTEGEFFIAREDGPELVGTMNGRTTVASNDQIVKGIQSGVFNAMMSALSYQDFGANVNITAEGDMSGLMNLITFKKQQEDRQFAN